MCSYRTAPLLLVGAVASWSVGRGLGVVSHRGIDILHLDVHARVGVGGLQLAVLVLELLLLAEDDGDDGHQQEHHGQHADRHHDHHTETELDVSAVLRERRRRSTVAIGRGELGEGDGSLSVGAVALLLLEITRSTNAARKLRRGSEDIMARRRDSLVLPLELGSAQVARKLYSAGDQDARSEGQSFFTQAGREATTYVVRTSLRGHSS